MTAGSREQLLERIKSFDYWHYPFDLGDGVVIESKHAKSALELRDFLCPAVLELCGGSLEGMQVLDIGCNAGFWSLEAHRLGAARVLGIDPRPAHIAQAELVRDQLQISPGQVEYQQMSVYDLAADRIGQFDLCLLLRVLHHLSHPLLAVPRVRAVCRAHLVVDVRLERNEDRPVFLLHGEDLDAPLHGVDGLALKPSRAAVETLLAAAHFDAMTWVAPKPPLPGDYFSGKRALLTARVATKPERPIGR
jgi:tRNA (mo5U34)-methyltransferase